MTEEANFRNWGWGLAFEPQPLENETQEHYNARHHQWCSARVKGLEKAYGDSEIKNRNLEREAKELREKNAAYETILSSRGKSGVDIHEPGSVVRIKTLNVEARILEVRIRVGGIPLYWLTYYADGSTQSTWLHGDDLSVDSPLSRPSELWGQNKR